MHPRNRTFQYLESVCFTKKNKTIFSTIKYTNAAVDFGAWTPVQLLKNKNKNQTQS